MTVTAIAMTLAAAPLFAQESGWRNANVYVTGMGGFTRATGNTTGDVMAEGGVRVLPHVMVFGDVGQYRNLTSDLQPTLASVSSMAASQGLMIDGGGTLPATYGLGGVRVELPAWRNMLLPYVLGGAGVAHLSPTPKFVYASGLLPGGSPASLGQDVTASIQAAGTYTPPSASSAFMFTTGAGVEVPLPLSRFVADVGYRYSRIAADSTLAAAPQSANGMTFGVGYRF